MIGFIKLTALVKAKKLEVYNLEGLTPLLASIKHNQKECVVLLLCLGAKLDAKTKYSEQTVWQLATPDMHSFLQQYQVFMSTEVFN